MYDTVLEELERVAKQDISEGGEPCHQSLGDVVTTLVERIT